MATPVSICSNALLLVGAQPIASLTEGTEKSRLCANLYQPTVDAILRAHTWNCCVKRVILAPNATAPTFDYTAAFNLPSDWLRTLQVGEYGNEIPFVTEGRKILANTTSLPLRYVARVGEDQWDSSLIDLVTLAMCAAIAYPVTKSAALAQTKRDDFLLAKKLAKAIDGQDDPPETLGDFPSYNSRFS